MAAGDRTISYGTRTAFSLVSNLASLANTEAKALGEVDNSSVAAPDYAIFLELPLAASGVSATGTVEIYLVEGQATGADETTDGIDMASTSNLAASIKNATLLAALVANANSQVLRWQARLGDVIRVVPPFWTLVVLNRSGAALAASGAEGYFQSFIDSIAPA